MVQGSIHFSKSNVHVTCYWQTKGQITLIYLNYSGKRLYSEYQYWNITLLNKFTYSISLKNCVELIVFHVNNFLEINYKQGGSEMELTSSLREQLSLEQGLKKQKMTQ